MRLASKILVVQIAVVVMLAGVGLLSLRAVGRVVDVNSEITTRTLPAVRGVTALHDALLALERLEVRHLVLGDAQYATLWDQRAVEARGELERLRGLMTRERQAALLRDAAEAFEAYARAVEEARRLLGAGRRQQALQHAETTARPPAEQVLRSLQALAEATHAAALAARAEAARLETRTWTGVITAFLAAVGLALLGAGLLAQRLTRSLRTLSSATAAVATGQFREPVHVTGRDEIADLASAFNAMGARLRELDELKETFLATVSHELRSPLTSIREGAQLLREEVSGPLSPKQARLVSIIELSSGRLLRLVNQILDFSRLRAGMLPIRREPVDLATVTRRAVDELRPHATEVGVALAVERVGEDFRAWGDDDRLIQVVVNLVANAVKFTGRGGRVVARVVDVGRELELQIEDTGIGIPPESLPHIFDWYRQGHRHQGGTGIGLAVVRGLVEAHGGRVTVESHPGKGSRFTVLLPRDWSQA